MHHHKDKYGEIPIKRVKNMREDCSFEFHFVNRQQKSRHYLTHSALSREIYFYNRSLAAMDFVNLSTNLGYFKIIVKKFSLLFFSANFDVTDFEERLFSKSI